MTDRLLVQIASYNTNLQGILGLPQDLVDWLSPTFQVSSFLSPERRAPDIVVVGFQELLPLHLGRKYPFRRHSASLMSYNQVSGFSKSVVDNKHALILSQIDANAPNNDRYSLIAKVVNVGVALLVYGRDEGVARTACDVQTQWTGTGPAYMGNKGAVGVRFRVPGNEGDVGETFTWVPHTSLGLPLVYSVSTRFVCAHLTAYEDRLAHRLADYRHIVGTLLFPPISSDLNTPSTIYSTSHLFFLGDLNFRVDIPATHPFSSPQRIKQALDDENAREELKEFDQLLVQHRKGTVFVGLREGEFWKFKCSYKYLHGEVDKYRHVQQLFLDGVVLYDPKTTARSVRRHGLTECCTSHTPTPPTLQINPTSPTFCIPQSPRIPRQTT